MKITKHDWILYIYNVAVVLTGAQVVWAFDFENRIFIFVISFIFGALWTVYFRWGMIGRFADHPKLLEQYRETE